MTIQRPSWSSCKRILPFQVGRTRLLEHPQYARGRAAQALANSQRRGITPWLSWEDDQLNWWEEIHRKNWGSEFVCVGFIFCFNWYRSSSIERKQLASYESQERIGLVNPSLFWEPSTRLRNSMQDIWMKQYQGKTGNEVIQQVFLLILLKKNKTFQHGINASILRSCKFPHNLDPRNLGKAEANG